ncbi:hypothetical protein Acr_27g0002900 [Actinidia rufa]|uniref:Uncharacterized protein n=1 Tax=Actinidia rufa TaxID=165716 RepID=A0A7J0H698_9ERIC|nr:hypothetical protein Acr_27g0002900 [Actinidia rufa]
MGEVVPFHSCPSANAFLSGHLVLKLGIPISTGITDSAPYTIQNGISPIGILLVIPQDCSVGDFHLFVCLRMTRRGEMVGDGKRHLRRGPDKDLFIEFHEGDKIGRTILDTESLELVKWLGKNSRGMLLSKMKSEGRCEIGHHPKIFGEVIPLDLVNHKLQIIEDVKGSTPNSTTTLNSVRRASYFYFVIGPHLDLVLLKLSTLGGITLGSGTSCLNGPLEKPSPRCQVVRESALRVSLSAQRWDELEIMA